MAKRSRLVAGIGGAITGAGLLAIQFTGGWEGLRLHAYQDVVGVWTACYGETKGIRPGMKFTKEQCDSLFIGSLTEHEAGMRKCLKAPDAIPEKTYVSLVSFTYNVGVGAFCRSTLARLANAGDLDAACRQLPRWNKAGGKVIKGLVNRRKAELALCLAGLQSPAPLPDPKPPIVEPAPSDPPVARDDSTVAWPLLVGFGVLVAAAVALLAIRRRRKQ